jgi:hypothetical protein
MFCLRTLRELKLLKFLSEAGVSENVSMSSPLAAPVLRGFLSLHSDPLQAAGMNKYCQLPDTNACT